MSFLEALDIAHLIEVLLAGKQPLGPILADAEQALTHALKAIHGLQALNAELQDARRAALTGKAP